MKALCLVLFSVALAGSLRAEADGEDDPMYLRGRTVFNQCRGCHTVNPQQASLMKGPSLRGIVGRKAGTLPGYADYSAAMVKSGIVWTPELIEAYIGNPKALVPDNKMAFVGLSDPQDRKAVVTYLGRVTTDLSLIHI